MCGSHLHSTWPGCTVLAFLDQQHRAVGHRVTSPARCSLGPMIDDLAVARQGDALALVVDHGVDALELDDAGLLGLDARSRRTLALDHAADVEGPHRQLRARLADRLGGDDADRHAFLDQGAGGQVHAVAQPADAQRRLAGHRAADQDLVQAQSLDLAGRLPGDHLVFVDDHLVR